MILFRTFTLSMAILLTSSAHAAKRDPVAAEQLFNEGRSALDRRDYVTACKKFEESHRLDPAAGTLMNRATCEQRRGRIATAWQLWREALDQLDPNDERVQYVRSQAQALEPRIPRLTVKPGVPFSAQVTVFRDGVLLAEGSLNIPLRVDPGSHVILVHMKGHLDQHYRFALSEREQREILVQTGPQLPQHEAKSGTTAPTLGYVLAGVGLASMGGAVVTHLLMNHEKDVIATNCPNKRCNEEGFAAVQDGKKLLIANRILWGLGGTAFVGGVALVLFESGPTGEERRVGLVLSPDSIGLVHRGRF
jgi:hypothetical protein